MSEKEYIERGALIRALDDHRSKVNWDILETHTNTLITFVMQEPAADVEPVVRGEYITDDLGDSSCSVCGEKWLNVTHKRCPNCAAYLERSGSDE